MKTVYLTGLALALTASRANAADAPSYTKDVKPFLKTYCLDCHGGRESKKGINVESVAKMMKARNFLVPGSPEKSRLYRSLTGSGKQMPPKKYQNQPTKEEIAKIKAWIAAGAKDDSKKGAAESNEETATTRRDPIAPGFPPGED